MRLAAVLTDLDGTLLDHGGVLGPEARGAIGELRRRGIPVVPLTSKTEVELRDLLAELDLGGIGSFENGAGVVGPGGRRRLGEGGPGVETSPRALEELAAPRGPAADAGLGAVRRAEIRRITGLPEARIPAMLARRFGLPFLAPEGAAEALVARPRAAPGRAADARRPLLAPLGGPRQGGRARAPPPRRASSRVPSQASATRPNDAGFLAECDVAVLVPRASGDVDPALAAAVPGGTAPPRSRPAAAGPWPSAALLGEESR